MNSEWSDSILYVMMALCFATWVKFGCADITAREMQVACAQVCPHGMKTFDPTTGKCECSP